MCHWVEGGYCFGEEIWEDHTDTHGMVMLRRKRGGRRERVVRTSEDGG